jgi:hypothetical protein
MISLTIWLIPAPLQGTISRGYERFSKGDKTMNVTALAATAATVVALSAGSAFAWDLHDSLAPAPNPTPTVSQSYAGGADLQIPGAGTVMSGSSVYDFQCADAKAKYPAGSFEVATFCAPGDR